MKDWDSLIADVDKIIGVHYTAGREGKAISKIVLHHNAGTLTVDQCYDVWQTREASAHYQVETSGRIGQLVNDVDTAWHAGDWATNLTSIGIEHANNALAPGWTISEATLDNGAHLVAALCRHYGLGRPAWGINVFPHSRFSSTSCPGAIAGAQNTAYMARAQAYYDGTQTTTQEDDDMDAETKTWIKETRDRVLGLGVQRYGADGSPNRVLDTGDGEYILNAIGNAVTEVFERSFDRAGGPTGTTNLHQTVAWLDANLNSIRDLINGFQARIAGLEEALKQVGGGTVDTDTIVAAVTKAVSDAIDAEIDSATVTLSTTQEAQS
ncbi:hypothetical protein GCM10009785_26620 [Brooklawnia cerclae]|uniref:N-acetylmuramoyl-L-alanine amidase n=1 Tax=Brooklawnia cerclae TaxID=349934 RepID=A0ABX0SHH1_9ACTN|nr:peptidoglycan recognition family protein [Brooklawnia cerclae]NIH57329.1 hypothetical protein [Brooklawnia cerclae]